MVAVGQINDEPVVMTAEVLAKTGRSFLELPTNPALNKHDYVVFYAIRNDQRAGIFGGSSPNLQVIALEGTYIPDGLDSHYIQQLSRYPVVNDDMWCVFTAKFQAGAAVLGKRGAQGNFELVADSTEAFSQFAPGVAVNRAGTVLFKASVDPEGHWDRNDTWQRERSKTREQLAEVEDLAPPMRQTKDGLEPRLHDGLFVERFDELVVVGGTKRDFADVDDHPALNNDHILAYRIYARGGKQKLVLNDGVMSPIPLAETGPEFRYLGPPSMNDKRHVAFYAEKRDGTVVICRNQYGRTTPKIVAQESEHFSIGKGAAINQAGDIAFVAGRAGHPDQLIVATNQGKLRHVVLDIRGEPIAIKHLYLGPVAFAPNRSLCVRAELEDGGSAILLLRQVK